MYNDLIFVRRFFFFLLWFRGRGLMVWMVIQLRKCLLLFHSERCSGPGREGTSIWRLYEEDWGMESVKYIILHVHLSYFVLIYQENLNVLSTFVLYLFLCMECERTERENWNHHDHNFKLRNIPNFVIEAEV